MSSLIQKADEILDEVFDEYEQHLGMISDNITPNFIEKCGDHADIMIDRDHIFVIETLCKLLIKERELNLYYKRRLEHVGSTTENG